ncbi:MAG: hypothetical protein MI725_02830, partial [Pirellulales bacterium]|nr:hypothetical protein [Pirellulales bacterium]
MKAQIHFVSMLSIVLIGTSATHAQHSDALIQDLDNRLASGTADFDTGNWVLGDRTYANEFDSDFAVNDPGWNTLGVGSPDMPAGAEALPANADLEWDFLPMKIDDTAANLFYWNGTGSVQFGGLPAAGYELSMQSKSAGFIPVDGSPALVAGEVIDNTDSTGALHRHRFFFLDDGDGNLGTDPADGIYLFSVRTRMAGLDRSKPLYFLFGTPGSTTAALTAAQQWVDGVVDELAPDFSADFDGDLDVDGTDFLNWQRGAALTGSAALQVAGDANFDMDVNHVDLGIWRAQYGSSLASFPGATSPLLASSNIATVPEPGALLLSVLCGATFLGLSWRHQVDAK